MINVESVSNWFLVTYLPTYLVGRGEAIKLTKFYENFCHLILKQNKLMTKIPLANRWNNSLLQFFQIEAKSQPTTWYKKL